MAETTGSETRVHHKRKGSVIEIVLGGGQEAKKKSMMRKGQLNDFDPSLFCAVQPHLAATSYDRKRQFAR